MNEQHWRRVQGDSPVPFRFEHVQSRGKVLGAGHQFRALVQQVNAIAPFVTGKQGKNFVRSRSFNGLCLRRQAAVQHPVQARQVGFDANAASVAREHKPHEVQRSLPEFNTGTLHPRSEAEIANIILKVSFFNGKDTFSSDLDNASMVHERCYMG